MDKEIPPELIFPLNSQKKKRRRRKLNGLKMYYAH